MRPSITRSTPTGPARRGLRVGVALAVLATGLVLGDRPAAATTVDVEVDTATAELYDPSFNPVATVDVLPATTTDCNPRVQTVTTTPGPDTIDVNVSIDQMVTIGGTLFRVWHTIGLEGAYDSGGSVWATGYWSFIARRSSGSCSSGSACIVGHYDLSLSGTLTAADPAQLTTGDELQLSGGNVSPSWVWPGGTACGPLAAHNGGAMDVTDLHLVVSAPPTPVPAAVTGGSTALRDPGGAAFDTIAHGALGSCSAPSASVAAGGTMDGGAVTVETTSDRPYRSPGGTDLRVVTSTTLNGSHSFGAADLTGSSTATLTRTTGGFGSCATVGGACTVSSSGLALTGSFTTASSYDPPSFTTGDTLTLAGGNTASETVVSGTPTDCADVLAIDAGSIGFTGLTLTGT